MRVSEEPIPRLCQLADRWTWSGRQPVVRLSFGSANFKAPGRRDEDVTLQLEYREEEAGIPPRQVNAASRFRRLLQALHRQSGQRVAVLVDEYDKPILDALEEPETARANRDYLRGLYGVIKDCDAHVRFTFLTGVSKFSKVFQTGYLTITGEERLGGEAPYRLGYPNREVRQSLNRVLLRHLVQDTAQQTANSIRLARLLETHDCAGLKELFHAFFASIPYQRYGARRCRRTNDDIADLEGFVPAWSTPTSRHWATRWRWRSRAATAGWTWRCAPADTCTCSSSRWRRWPRRDPRWHNCRNAATRTSTGPGAIRST